MINISAYKNSINLYYDTKNIWSHFYDCEKQDPLLVFFFSNKKTNESWENKKHAE